MKRKLLALTMAAFCVTCMTACGSRKTLDEPVQTPDAQEEVLETTKPTQTDTPEPTSTPVSTEKPKERVDAENLYDDIFAPIVNHDKGNTLDILKQTLSDSEYKYKKGKNKDYTIYSKSSKKTYVYVSYLERDSGLETPMCVTFALDGKEVVTMSNYSSDGFVQYDDLKVNGNWIQSTASARAIIFD